MVEIMRTVKAGDIAGDFTLRDNNGSNFILSRHRGIAFFKTYPVSQLPDVDEIIEVIRRMA